MVTKREVLVNYVTEMVSSKVHKENLGNTVLAFEKDYYKVLSGSITALNADSVNIPADAIEYSVKEFIKLRGDYDGFHIIVNAIKEGLEKSGRAKVYCRDGEKYYVFNVEYKKDHKHLVFFNHYKKEDWSPIVNTLDISDLRIPRNR